MFDLPTRAYPRESYTIDLSGLATHAHDTLSAYASALGSALREIRAELPGSRIGPGRRCQAEFHVPDSSRVR